MQTSKPESVNGERNSSSRLVGLYDFLQRRRLLRWGLLSGLSLLFALAASRLSYSEDITDFLPLDEAEKEALSVYQELSGANKIIAIFENPHDEDMTVDAIEAFCMYVSEHDTLGLSGTIVRRIDIEELNEVAGFVRSNIPYFLTQQDYRRMDSILAEPGYMEKQLEADREALMFPATGMLAESIAGDPLALFSPVLERLGTAHVLPRFETYNGYIFSPDMRRAFVMIDSPHGNSETDHNARLISLLESGIGQTRLDFPQVKAHLTGGPCIAVQNAAQIEQDSILALTISAVLIALLLGVFIRSVRHIALIGIAVGWGWLFALCGISFVHSSISAIVIGISSIIIGIAVNYPLHFISHTHHEPNAGRTLKDIAVPLTIGNISTIGAFLALVPLKGIALRDLGLFASLLLLGTILFVLIFLPHMVRAGGRGSHHGNLLHALTAFRPEKKPWTVGFACLLTAVFAWFSMGTTFDVNMTDINYLTEEQREDMAYLQTLTGHTGTDSLVTLYVVSAAPDIDDALAASVSRQTLLDSLAAAGAITGKESATALITTKAEQQQRLELWADFLARHDSLLHEELPQAAARTGFGKAAFSAFYETLHREFVPKAFEEFSPLTHTALRNYFCIRPSGERCAVVDKVYVPADSVDAAKQYLPGSFNAKSLGGNIADSLTADFNYIGLACSAIVFLLLWLSFGRIELAILSFIPMAVSWIWILGIMSLLDIHFNIVNIILATFIFGQGDDYTIFITEGCCHEYAYRRPVLASFKGSILLSALIMFVGVGSLAAARHPALLSIAHVTVVGMFCVVFMAYLFPPLLFDWLTRSGGQYRRRPLTIGAMAGTWLFFACGTLLLGTVGMADACMAVVCGGRGRRRQTTRRMLTTACRLWMRRCPGVKNRLHNPGGETFEKPCVISFRHRSALDVLLLVALSPKIVVVADRNGGQPAVLRTAFEWLGACLTVGDDAAQDMQRLERLARTGRCPAFCIGQADHDSAPEAGNDAFLLAQRLELDLLPVYLHGTDCVLPAGDLVCHAGRITVGIGNRIAPHSPLRHGDGQRMAKRVRDFCTNAFRSLKKEWEDAEYFMPLVRDQYLYKGRDTYADACRALSAERLYAVDHMVPDTPIVIKNCGSGALALLAALVHPDREVVAIEEDADSRLLATHCIQGLATNVRLQEHIHTQ